MFGTTIGQAARKSRARPLLAKSSFTEALTAISDAEGKAAALHAEWKRLNDAGSALMQRWFAAETESDMRAVAGEMQQVADALTRLIEQAAQMETVAGALSEQLAAAYDAEDERISALTDLITDVTAYGDQNELQTEIDGLEEYVADLQDDE